MDAGDQEASDTDDATMRLDATYNSHREQVPLYPDEPYNLPRPRWCTRNAGQLSDLFDCHSDTLPQTCNRGVDFDDANVSNVNLSEGDSQLIADNSPSSPSIYEAEDTDHEENISPNDPSGLYVYRENGYSSQGLHNLNRRPRSFYDDLCCATERTQAARQLGQFLRHRPVLSTLLGISLLPLILSAVLAGGTLGMSFLVVLFIEGGLFAMATSCLVAGLIVPIMIACVVTCCVYLMHCVRNVVFIIINIPANIYAYIIRRCLAIVENLKTRCRLVLSTLVSCILKFVPFSSLFLGLITDRADHTSRPSSHQALAPKGSRSYQDQGRSYAAVHHRQGDQQSRTSSTSSLLQCSKQGSFLLQHKRSSRSDRDRRQSDRGVHAYNSSAERTQGYQSSGDGSSRSRLHTGQEYRQRYIHIGRSSSNSFDFQSRKRERHSTQGSQPSSCESYVTQEYQLFDNGNHNAQGYQRSRRGRRLSKTSDEQESRTSSYQDQNGGRRHREPTVYRQDDMWYDDSGIYSMADLGWFSWGQMLFYQYDGDDDEEYGVLTGSFLLMAEFFNKLFLFLVFVGLCKFVYLYIGLPLYLRFVSS